MKIKRSKPLRRKGGVPAANASPSKADAYYKFLKWSDEDQCFIGRCPSLFLGGVHGEDKAKVYGELCKVAEEWMDLLQQEGRELPRHKP